MMYIYGNGWEHDLWHCVHKVEGRPGVCGHEIELNVSTFVDIDGSEHEAVGINEKTKVQRKHEKER